LIKLVIFDADETLWHVEEGYASTLVLPLRKVNDGLVIDAVGVKVWLFHGVRELLEGLRRRGVIVSLASANDEEPNKVKLLLELFGIMRYFSFPQVNWQKKSQNVRKIVELVREKLGVNLDFEEVIFIDDSEFNVTDVKNRCPGVKAFRVGRDIPSIALLYENLDSFLQA